MSTAPVHLRTEVAEFRGRLRQVRRALRTQAKSTGGLGTRLELALVNGMLVGLGLGGLAVKGLRPPLRWAKRVYRGARRRLQPGWPPAGPPPVPGPSPLELIAARRACYPRRTFTAMLCNYNDASFLERAIISVVTQSRPPDEYLLLDDASTDNSVEIMEHYAARYPFIRVVRKKKNGGYLKGICELTEIASGDWIHRGSSDDFMWPGFIENLMLLAEVFPHAGIVSGELAPKKDGVEGFGLSEIPGWVTGYVPPGKYLRDYLEVGDPCCTLAPSTIFRKEAVLEMGGWRPELGTWDVSFALQACALKYGMCYLDAPIYTWVMREKASWTHQANSNFSRSTEVNLNYLRLMRSPPFRDLFSETFARRWFASNVEVTARIFAESTCEQLDAEISAETAAPVQASPATPKQTAARRQTFTAMLCNYNDAAYLERAISAVVSQSRLPDEYLIMDDGSSDASPEIIARYAARYPFIKFIRKQKNEGCLKGISELTALAAGDFVHWGASDDLMLPGFIENLMRLADAFPHAGIISGQLQARDSKGNCVGNPEGVFTIPGWKTGFVPPDRYLHEYLEVGDPCCTLSPSTIYRKDVIEEAGGWREELGTWAVSFVLQLGALKYGMCYLDMPVYTWFARPEAWTQRANNDLTRSTQVNLNYLRLIRSPQFRHLFSVKFAHLWFLKNMELTARSFSQSVCEQMVEENRGAA